MIPNYSASDDRVHSNQSQDQGLAGNPVITRSIQAILSRSILAAHLLIGDITEAEKVIMEAIDVREPDEQHAEHLFQITLRAAVNSKIALSSAGSIKDGASDCQLPVELRRVLQLPRELRKSFVLRALVGLPSQVCAQILEVGIHEVSEYTCAAMKRLSALDG